MKPPTVILHSYRNVLRWEAVGMPMFVLYNHPSDFPAHIVVRLWDAARGCPTVFACLADDLESARALVPEHLHRFEPTECDDPVIIESYL